MISKQEDQSSEIIQFKEQKEKRMYKNEQSLSNLGHHQSQQ